jgi:hypothetical protein
LLLRCGPSATRPYGFVEVLSANVSDNEVWAHACDHQRILITCNRDDFLALAKATEIHPGLIILTRRRTR